MSPDPESPPDPAPAAPPPPGIGVRVLRVLTGILLSVILPLAVLAAAVHYGRQLLDDPPKAQRKTRERRAPVVRAEPLRFGRHETTVSAMGSVLPARVVELRPRVSGEVVETSPELVFGGRFREGDVVLTLDRRDFELAVRQREADLARAESALRLEEGQRAVAAREFELMGQDTSPEERALVLREPQIASARAEVAAATAALERAKLDLERTVVRAPFNALVRSYDVDRGTQISTQTRIATLEGTDSCWVEVSVPVDRLPRIRLPVDGVAGADAVVRVEAVGKGRTRVGRVVRLVGDLEPSGRLARLLIGVDDPFSLLPGNRGKPKLLFGSYLRVDVAGPVLESAAVLDRTHLRDGDRVWVVDGEDRLRIRAVTVADRSRDSVLVTGGIEPGERVVVSELSAAVEGMLLRVEPAGEPGAESGGTEAANAGGADGE